MQKGSTKDFSAGTVDINLPAIAGTQVQTMVWEDFTCHGTTKAHVP